MVFGRVVRAWGRLERFRIAWQGRLPAGHVGSQLVAGLAARWSFRLTYGPFVATGNGHGADRLLMPSKKEHLVVAVHGHFPAERVLELLQNIPANGGRATIVAI